MELKKQSMLRAEIFAAELRLMAKVYNFFFFAESRSIYLCSQYIVDQGFKILFMSHKNSDCIVQMAASWI